MMERWMFGRVFGSWFANFLSRPGGWVVGASTTTTIIIMNNIHRRRRIRMRVFESARDAKFRTAELL